jgi:hypothetical protein
MEMRISKILMAMACALTAVVVFATATPSQAQNEPHYLQALSELRTARDYIQFDKGGPYAKERKTAVEEINKAIDEIKHAAWDDGKNTQFAPPAQGVTTGWAPIHQAEKWLSAAKGHASQGVDIPQNQGLRERILYHINAALSITDGVRQAGLE